MKKSDHVLSTRFNTRLSTGVTPKSNVGRHLDPTWLEPRLDLFERFCLPSLNAQTSKDFQWHVYIHRDTPDPYKSRIVDMLGRSPLDTRLFLVDTVTSEDLLRNCEQNRSAGSDILLTTNMDNDDAVSRDFVRRLRLQITAAPRFISFPRGYQFHVPTGKLYLRKELSNPFVTRLEIWGDGPQTVHVDYHNRLPRHGPFQYLQGRQWMQLIHASNVLNRLQGVRCGEAGFDGFAVRPDYLSSESGLTVLLDGLSSFTRLQSEKFRKMVRN